MDELFVIPPSKSPKQLWIERHNLNTQEAAELAEPWSCWSGNLSAAIDAGKVAHGNTEDDAIVQWAIQNHVRLWNEEAVSRDGRCP